jgi:hypothetical protein
MQRCAVPRRHRHEANLPRRHRVHIENAPPAAVRSVIQVYCASSVRSPMRRSAMGASHWFGQLIFSVVAASTVALPVSEALGRDRGGGGSGSGGHHHGGRPGHGWGGAGWGAGYWGPGFWGWPYYGYGFGWPSSYAYPTVVMVTTTTTADAVPRTTATEWYYCPDSGLFFPHASECTSGWQTVPTSASPSARPMPLSVGPPPQ